MSRILAIAVKDLRLLIRDRTALFFLLIFPVIYGVFFAYLFGGGDEPRSAHLQIAVVDRDDSDQSHQFVAELRKSNALSIELTTQPAASEAVRRGRRVAYIEIPKGFGQTAGLFGFDAPELEVGIDPSRSAETGMLEGLIMQATVGLMKERFMNPETFRPQVQKNLAEIRADSKMPIDQRLVLTGFMTALDTFLGAVKPSTMSEAPSMEPARVRTVDVTAQTSARGKLLAKIRSPFQITFPSAMMWGVMGCAAGFAVSLVKEKSDGTLTRLRIAPITRAALLAGKALACFLASLFVLLFMLALGRFVFRMQLGSIPLLAVAVLCTASSWVGIMMLLSVIGRTEQGVGGISWAILVVLAMIGGGMVPLAFLPPFMQKASMLSPIRWGIEALEGAIWRGYSPAEMALPCGVLLAVGALCFVTGVRIFAARDN